MSLTFIDLGLRDVFNDNTRRHEFFKSITQDEIASQIRALRKKRHLSQTAFAQITEMKQSAVSRIEQAEYSSWTLSTLFKVAAGLNARWRMILQPAEEAIAEFERCEELEGVGIIRDAASKIAALTGHMPAEDAARRSQQEAINHGRREPGRSEGLLRSLAQVPSNPLAMLP